MTRRAILWVTVALLGIAATAAVAWLASQLAAQQIGISSEPLSVASGLAPSSPATGHRRPAGPGRPPSRHRPGATPSRSSGGAPQPPPSTATTPATAPVAGTGPSRTSASTTVTIPSTAPPPAPVTSAPSHRSAPVAPAGRKPSRRQDDSSHRSGGAHRDD